MCDLLNLNEFLAIKKNLELISDTWSDLWVALYLSQVKPTQMLKLKFDDVRKETVYFEATTGLDGISILLNSGLNKLIRVRRSKYPDDEFVFQSHTNRTLATPRPVTLVAFNMALKKASYGVTLKLVSSKSARFLKETG